MSYTLHQLAPGSYDLVLDGLVVGSVVREVTATGREKAWHAELLDDAGPAQRPKPFSATEHSFRSLAAVTDWLSGAVIVEAERLTFEVSARS